MHSQLKKGIVELLILKIVMLKPRSSFDVIELLAKHIDISENTVYPILRRLTNQGFFETASVQQSIGAPRKLYSITQKGEKKLLDFEKEWTDFLNAVLTILGGDIND